MKALSKSRTYTNYEILLLLDNPEKNKIILNFIKEHRQTAIKVVYCTSACNKFVTFSRLAEKLDSEFLLFLEGRIDPDIQRISGNIPWGCAAARDRGCGRQGL